MIKSFRDQSTEDTFHRIPTRKLSSSLQHIALRKLLMLHAALYITDLKVPPGNRLEALKGKRTGQWSIRINDQWRICFEFKDGHAYNVEIIDYH